MHTLIIPWSKVLRHRCLSVLGSYFWRSLPQLPVISNAEIARRLDRHPESELTSIPGIRWGFNLPKIPPFFWHQRRRIVFLLTGSFLLTGWLLFLGGIFWTDDLRLRNLSQDSEFSYIIHPTQTGSFRILTIPPCTS